MGGALQHWEYLSEGVGVSCKVIYVFMRWSMKVGRVKMSTLPLEGMVGWLGTFFDDVPGFEQERRMGNLGRRSVRRCCLSGEVFGDPEFGSGRKMVSPGRKLVGWR